MKILLDEQLHIAMKQALSNFSVSRVKDMDWEGLKNGELREKLNENAFDFLITADKNLPFQQNLQKLKFAILLIDTQSLKREDECLFVDTIQGFLSHLPQPSPKLIFISSLKWVNYERVAKLQALLPPNEFLLLFI